MDDDTRKYIKDKIDNINPDSFDNEINGSFPICNNTLPDWCKERYCDCYDLCKYTDIGSDTNLPDCFYGRLETEDEINCNYIKLLMSLGHTRECALQFIFEDCFDDLHRRKCICHNSTASAFIDYDYYTTNFN